MAKIVITFPNGEKKTFSSPAAMADELGKVKAERLAADKVAAGIKEKETALSNWFIDNLSRDDATGISGSAWGVKIKPDVIPQVQDWDKFYAYVSKERAFHLLQKRVAPASIEEIWSTAKEAVREKLSRSRKSAEEIEVAEYAAMGKAVPGVVPFHIKKISLTQVK